MAMSQRAISANTGCLTANLTAFGQTYPPSDEFEYMYILLTYRRGEKCSDAIVMEMYYEHRMYRRTSA